MNVHLFQDAKSLAACAAAIGAEAIRAAIAERGTATVVMASAASQMEMIACLLKEPDVAWQRVRIFHLDEYVGLPVDHPASFRRFLWERFLKQLPLPPREICLLNGETDAEAECLMAGELICQSPVDVAFIGIGENCHVAFNDPPADFATTAPYIVVELDEPCRRQQVGEGWFPTLDAVPRHAISMSVHQILMSRRIICTVPDARKAAAVKATIEGPVTPAVPASCLQEHPLAELFIDVPAASQLSEQSLSACIRH
jgi:glucosamine-6-phosphate deaminase